MKYKQVDPTHNLYLIRVYNKEKTLIKFGYSSKIKERLQCYYNHNPLIEVVETYYREDGVEFESDLHSIINSEVMREWYTEDKIDLIKHYITHGIPKKVVKEVYPRITYIDLVDIYLTTGSIEDYSYKQDYYNIIKNSIKYYNKVWHNYTYAKQMIEQYSNEYAKLIITIRSKFTTGKVYPVNIVKSILQEIYSEFKLTRKAKSTDLQEFMLVKETRSSNGRFIEILNKYKSLK